MSFDKSKLRVIFAEDEYVFREIAEPEIISAGVKPENLYMVEDGREAYEKARELFQSSADMVMMVLDLRMPGMDGRQCALKTRELIAEKNVQVEPFIVCCSASNSDTKVEAEGAAFHLTVPKPFSTKQIQACLKHIEEWSSTRPNLAGSSGSGRAFSVEAVEAIIVEDEATISMALGIELGRLGISADRVTEAEDDDEMLEALTSAKSGDADKPLLVIAGKKGWAQKACGFDMGPRAAFVVLAAEGSSADGVTLIRRPANEQDLKEMLAKFSTWWSRA